jgi:hypothetical protein
MAPLLRVGPAASLLAVLALAMTGCQTANPIAGTDPTPTGSVVAVPAIAAGAPGDTQARRELDVAAALYRADPANAEAAIRYAAAAT